ncbi:hypothetical protein ABIE59_004037, partial [Marinobacter sp. MBR-99]|uniref:hypothetical protein n=1 Tax=Marinobacter sp. MBR-99 TaxID=3156461 RepID=UPI00339201E8
PRRYAPMGGSLAPVRVAGFTWNGWQPSAVYAALPAFISLTDWSSLLPSSSALRVSLLIFQYLTNRLQDMRGYVLLEGLLVDHQQPDLTISQPGEEGTSLFLGPNFSGICFECCGFDDGKRDHQYTSLTDFFAKWRMEGLSRS